MKRTSLLFVLGVFCSVVFSQNTIIPNNSFEMWWQDTCYVINDVGDVWMDDTVCARSEDAAMGDFALYLKTSGLHEGTDVSPNVSYVVFGSTEDFPVLKGIPYAGMGSPDSLVLSYKAFMQNEDSSEIWVSFFKEGSQQSFDVIKLGHQEDYVDTSFALSELVSMPDSVFLAYTSGNVRGEGDTDGNEVWIDNVSFKEASAELVSAPYGDFEAWDTVVSLEMDELHGVSETVAISPIAFAGSYAITVRSQFHDYDQDPYYDNFMLWGELVDENDKRLLSGGLPLAGERNMLSFYYKYELNDVNLPDSAEAILYLFNAQEDRLVTTNVYLPPSDTFCLAHIWYSPMLRDWGSGFDSMAVEFRASRFRSEYPAYSLEDNTLWVDSLFFQSEAVGDITIQTPDTAVDNNANITVRYENTSGGGTSEIFIDHGGFNSLALDYGQEGGNVIVINASPNDTFMVYVRDYYNFDIVDSFRVAVLEEEGPEEPVILQEMPDPGFENWKLYDFDYPSGTQTRNTDDGDTAICVEKVASPDGEGFALKLINVGQNSMGNNISYALIAAQDDDGMAPKTYSGTTPNKLKLWYQTSIAEGNNAMVWVQFYKAGEPISSDTIMLPPMAVFGDATFDLVLSEDDPDSVLLAYASGYAWGDDGDDGDFVIIDNVSFLNGTMEVGAPENGGFESWESLTLHQSEAMGEQEGYVRRTEDVASGDYALYMKTVKDEDSEEYPYYNPVLLWGDYDANQGLVVDRYLDELVFSYKYQLANASFPDTAMASLVLYNQEQEMWFGTELLAQSNAYQEARIALDTSMYDWSFDPTMMRLELSSSKYRENYDPNYPYAGNELYIDDIYWHRDAVSALEILTPDTVVRVNDDFKVRFSITGSRSSHYMFMGADKDGEDSWYISSLVASDVNDISFAGNYSAGDKFYIYMIDYFNREVKDSVMITMDVASDHLLVPQAKARLYPLPVVGALTIEHDLTMASVLLYNVSGQLMATLYPRSVQATIDFSNYPEGMYFLSVKTQKGVENQIIIK